MIALRRPGRENLKPISQFRPETVTNVLAVSSTAIGDTLFATPAIRVLSRLMPHSSIDLIVRDKFSELFKNNPHIRKLLKYNGHYRNSLQLLRQIKANDYGLCIVFHDSDPYPVEASYLSGIPFIVRIGQKDKPVAGFLSTRTAYRTEEHAIEQRLDVLRKVFNIELDSQEDKKMVLPVTEAEADDFWMKKLNSSPAQQKNYIKVGFQFSASSSYKAWPFGNFVELGAKLIENSEHIIIALFGGPKDKSAAKDMVSRITESSGKKNRVVNLAKNIRLQDLPAAIKGINLLIANDTGPLHVAIAVQTPTISLFVPSNIHQTGPLQDPDLHTVISKPKPCSPCIEKYCTNPYCMNLITVDEVFDAAIFGMNLN